MDDIIAALQKDILDPNTSLVTILLKAKVLAHQLKNDQFKQWVRSELDGYDDRKLLPDYRIVGTQSTGLLSNGYRSISNMSIPISILPDWLQEAVRQIRLTQGIRAIEELAQNENGATWKWPAEWLGTLNEVRDTHADDYYQYYDATRSISPTVFAQIVATVRSRLQDFVLELCDLQWKMGQEPPPSREIQHLFNVTITNTAQGGSVATFDQRGQNVNYQYNAAGDINFGAVQNRQEFITELEKLKGELQKAAAATVIDADVATEAEYQLSKAVNQAKKPDADQKTVLEHINGAKTLIESVAAAGGLVTGLLTAAEHVQKFFGG